MAPTAWAGQVPDVDKPGTQGAVAYSEEGGGADEPVPYTGPEHTGGYGQEPPGFTQQAAVRYPAEPGPLPWYKRTALVLSVAGAAAAVLVAVVLALTLGDHKTSPVNTTPPNTPAPPQTSITTTVIGPNDSPTVTVLPPPPAPSSTESPAPATTSEAPATTTAAPTTTQPTTTVPTTSAPVTTSAQTTSRPGPPTPPFHRGPIQPPFGGR